MSHRDKLIDGDEWDAVTGWRRVFLWRPGRRRWIKNKINRRARRESKRRMRDGSDEG